MSAPNAVQIEQTTNGFRVRVSGNPNNSGWEYYPASAVKSVVPVKVIGMGDRQPDNNRLNPIQYDDMLMFVISFHDENNTSPLRYDIQSVTNQVGWTPNANGLAQAVADINSWLGTTAASLSAIASDIAAIEAAMIGNTETPSTVQNATSGGAGTTTAGVKGFSILFEGSGGTLNGVPVQSGYIKSVTPSLGNELGSEAYVVPNVADPDFPLSPRVVISYVS